MEFYWKYGNIMKTCKYYDRHGKYGNIMINREYYGKPIILHMKNEFYEKE